MCTADPEMEPPAMVISTVLSVMAYDYPTEKLSVYLSDDAGSELTYYALMEASQFAKHWIPFCKKFNIQPRSPAAYFASQADHQSKEVVLLQVFYKMNRLLRILYVRFQVATNGCLYLDGFFFCRNYTKTWRVESKLQLI